MSEQTVSSALIGTTMLCENLFKADSLEQFLETNADNLQAPPFDAYITGLCQKRGEAPERVIARANIENSFGHQIFNGRRKPSRDTVIQLAFGLEADVELAQTLLKYAQKNRLYPRVKRDAAILYCLHNRLTLLHTQTVLHDLDLPLIGGNRS